MESYRLFAGNFDSAVLVHACASVSVCLCKGCGLRAVRQGHFGSLRWISGCNVLYLQARLVCGSIRQLNTGLQFLWESMANVMGS